MATVMRTDGSSEERKRITFKECQEVVQGYVEVVYMEEFTVLCNEEGLLKGLPFNDKASDLVGMDLVGDVVLLSSGKETDQVLDGPDSD